VQYDKDEGVCVRGDANVRVGSIPITREMKSRREMDTFGRKQREIGRERRSVAVHWRWCC
jgi:hypothetical protein